MPAYGLHLAIAFVLVLLAGLFFLFLVFVAMGITPWLIKPEEIRPPWKDWGIDDPVDNSADEKPK